MCRNSTNSNEIENLIVKIYYTNHYSNIEEEIRIMKIFETNTNTLKLIDTIKGNGFYILILE